MKPPESATAPRCENFQSDLEAATVTFPDRSVMKITKAAYPQAAKTANHFITGGILMKLSRKDFRCIAGMSCTRSLLR